MLDKINEIAKEQINIRQKVADMWRTYIDDVWKGIDTEEQFLIMKKELLSHKDMVKVNSLVIAQMINGKVDKLNLPKEHRVSYIELGEKDI